MPTIVFASSKGGAGKTTAAILLAGGLSQIAERQSIQITLIDADPNQHSAKWALKPNCPQNLKLVQNATADNILDAIEEGEKNDGFVIVDLEGTASLTVTSAASRADLVIIPCQGSQADAEEAAKTIKLLKNQGRVLGRNIPFAVLMTRTNPAIVPRTLLHITSEFERAGIDLFTCSIIDREAFRAVLSFGGLVSNLPKSEVSGIEKATDNMRAFVLEVIEKLTAHKNAQPGRRAYHG
ncbi:ParA family protein [Methylomagnum ishizawai]|uniref:ParA family protein n=1 Tax=Methylomagnum ishizawai TaxID=1760988 RepID=UPI001C331B9B|nr:ParA family protein [Methylomagnum ishizawai]BBL77549.1 chromosome partitioning protein ParA [Methylomagnum ishizawai]